MNGNVARCNTTLSELLPENLASIHPILVTAITIMGSIAIMMYYSFLDSARARTMLAILSHQDIMATVLSFLQPNEKVSASLVTPAITAHPDHIKTILQIAAQLAPETNPHPTPSNIIQMMTILRTMHFSSVSRAT